MPGPHRPPCCSRYYKEKVLHSAGFGSGEAEGDCDVLDVGSRCAYAVRDVEEDVADDADLLLR